jgi:hypothetical protein
MTKWNLFFPLNRVHVPVIYRQWCKVLEICHNRFTDKNLSVVFHFRIEQRIGEGRFELEPPETAGCCGDLLECGGEVV